MLNEQTLEKLWAMKLHGMAEAYEEQKRQAQVQRLSFEERLALLVDRQWLWKEDRALRRRLQYAGLKQSACIEDIDYRHRRGLDRATIEHLATSEWVRYHQNCIITGPTGVGKSFLACALAHKACRDGYRALYFLLPKLFRAITMAQADGSLMKLLKKVAAAEVLVIDDWGLANTTPRQYREFLELLDDRHGSGATVLTSQFPINTWHELIGDPTVADAILDRLVHNAHHIELQGDSLRKKRKEK